MSRFLTGLLVVLLSSVACGADERVLLLDNGRDGPVAVSGAALLEQHTVLTLAIDDLEYEATHTYQAIDLKALLTQAGFAPGAQLLLVCTDGYSIPFDSTLLDDAHWQGLLALQDLQAPEGLHFVPFQHGADLVNFDPFYIVWSANSLVETVGSTTPSSALTLRDLPWPYQLTEIRLLQASDYQSALPAAAAPPEVSSGFDLYFKHCIKCHSVNGSGGTLGSALDQEHGLLSVLQRSEINALIRQIDLYYPQSKMPDFRDTLDTADTDAIIAYLQWMLEAE